MSNPFLGAENLPRAAAPCKAQRTPNLTRQPPAVNHARGIFSRQPCEHEEALQAGHSAHLETLMLRCRGCRARCVLCAGGSRKVHLCGRCLRLRGIVATRARWGEEPGAERIRDLRAAGRSLRFIAREVGCSPATVLRALQGVSCHPEDYSPGDRGAA